MNELLEQHYSNPKSNGAFGGINKLYRSAKDVDRNVKRDDVKTFLRGKDSYTLNKFQKIRFPRRQFIARGMYDQYQADLADFSKFAWHNSGMKWIMVIVDIWTKVAYAIPLKNKEGQTVAVALENFFKSNPIPRHFVTDAGHEFTATIVKKIFDKYGVNAYTINSSPSGAAVAERFIRTLKGSIYRFMTENNTKRYIDVLPDLVTSYNKTVHSAHKMKPDDVTADDHQTVKERLYRPITCCDRKRLLFKIGDKVRIALERKTFHRGFQQQYSKEKFVITDIFFENVPIFKLSTIVGGEKIVGSYYAQQLTLSS